MLRHPSLVPLSHQHQHALALCVRLERGLRLADTDLGRWHAEIVQLFDDEIRHHFAGEEQVLFPAAERVPELRELVSELIRDHVALAAFAGAAHAGSLSASELLDFANTLSAHVRKEERQLFEIMQAELAPEELSRIGVALVHYFRAAGVPLEGDSTVNS